MTSNTRERLWAELWLRQDTFGTYEPQQAILDRVRSLESTGVFGETTVAGCGRRVPTDRRGNHADALAALETFEAWAEHAGADLAPAFDRREQSPLLSNVTTEVAVFPVVTLALYDGNDLGAVFPCTVDGRIYTVENCLDALEVGHGDELLDPLWTPTPSGGAVDPAADVAPR